MSRHYPLGDFSIETKDRLIIVQFSGAFNVEGIELYIAALKKTVAEFNGGPWALIGDINDLELSVFDTTQLMKELVDWMWNHQCFCIINVAAYLNPVVTYQVDQIKAHHPILEAKSLVDAFKLYHEARQYQLKNSA